MTPRSMPNKESLRRVFHPSDFSQSSQIAFAHALKLALATHGSLSTMHIDNDQRHIPWADFPGVRTLLERWNILPENSRKEDVRALGLSINKVAGHGKNAADAVLHYLDDHPADLIVLATHQYDGFERWLHKSIAEPIARASCSQTLFIPHAQTGFIDLDSGQVRLKNILLPIDTQPSPQAALNAVTDLLHVLPPQDAGVTVTALHVGKPGDAPALNPPSLPAVTWQTISHEGKVVDEILAAATRTQADLICMATEGHQGFLDALRGSTSERVIRAAPCPVLAIPAI